MLKIPILGKTPDEKRFEYNLAGLILWPTNNSIKTCQNVRQAFMINAFPVTK